MGFTRTVSVLHFSINKELCETVKKVGEDYLVIDELTYGQMAIPLELVKYLAVKSTPCKLTASNTKSATNPNQCNG